MTRYARETLPGALYHVISRFVNREYRFTDDDERAEYLDRVTSVVRATDWTPVAYALMSSHVHWVLLAGEDSSARFVHPLHVGFAGWINRRQGRLGPVFAERHRIVPVHFDIAPRLLAYVHNNPVRAGVVDEPRRSSWTSHRAYVGDDEAPPWLAIDKGLSLSGLDESPIGRATFATLVDNRRNLGRDLELCGATLPSTRAIVRRTLTAPVELVPKLGDAEGRPSFGIVSRAPVVRRVSGGATAALVVDETAELLGVSVERIRSPERTRQIVDARRVALIAWAIHMGRPQIEMGTYLGLTTGATSQLLYRFPEQLEEAGHYARLVAEVSLEKAETVVISSES